MNTDFAHFFKDGTKLNTLRGWATFKVYNLTILEISEKTLRLFVNSSFIWHSNVRLLPGFAYQLRQRRSRQVGFVGEIEGQTDKKPQGRWKQGAGGHLVPPPYVGVNTSRPFFFKMLG